MKEKHSENLLEFKHCVSVEFKDDPMLQLYVKYRLSSIFDKIHLYKMFSHFSYCKRLGYSENEFCRMCSRIYPHCLIDKFYLFDEVLIDDRFTSNFKAFFKPQCYMYLDIKHPHRMFLDPNKAKFYDCMQFVCRKNSREVLTTFLSIFIRVYLNNVLLIFNEIRTIPEVSFEQYSNFRQKGARLAYNLLISLCCSMNTEPFEKIYQDFVPLKDYDSNCFKILNKHYLKYLEFRE